MTATIEAAGRGTELAKDTYPPITRYTLAMYAAASADNNPIHLDSDLAKSAGLPDVFAHGMLVMGYLGRTLKKAAGDRKIVTFSTRFLAITWVGNEITCTATVTGQEDTPAGRVAKLDLLAVDQTGEIKLKGEATVALG